MHAIIAVVPPQFGVQVPEHVPHPAATRFPTPGGEPLDRVPQFLARRAALQMRLARTIGAPAKLKAYEVKTGAAPGVLATERDHPRLVRRPFQSKLAQPWPQLVIEAFGLRLILKRSHIIVRVSDRQASPRQRGLTTC